MKKSKKILLIVIAIVAILLSFVGGQVYAKYMSRVTGKGTADIASWSFKVNENDEKLQTISLASTINNSKLIDNKIAPGTEGEFQIKIDAKGSDVGVSYAIRFENESQKPSNLKFTYKDNTCDSLTDLQQYLTGIINADEEEKDKVRVLTISWQWEYETGNTVNEIEDNDLIDTKNAKAMSNYTFDVIVSGTQVDPRVNTETSNL